MALRRRHNAGYSMAEMVVVLGVVGMMLAMALPSLMQRRPSYYADAAAQQLLSEFRRVRTRSMASGSSTELRFSPSRTSFTVWTDLNGDGTTTDTGSVTRPIEGLGSL